MNRRQMLARLLGGAAVPTVMYQPPSQPEQPLTALHPYCPRCGDAMLFETSWWKVDREAGPLTPVPVTCLKCSLTVQSPAFYRIP